MSKSVNSDEVIFCATWSISKRKIIHGNVARPLAVRHKLDFISITRHMSRDLKLCKLPLALFAQILFPNFKDFSIP